ncbi:hypothetical protein ABGB07_22175 [Micromonosporaceae bacterium B7E4]
MTAPPAGRVVPAVGQRMPPRNDRAAARRAAGECRDGRRTAEVFDRFLR